MPNNFDERFEQMKRSAGSETPAHEAATSGLNFIIATELVDLPTKGKFYPQDHPLHNKETVEIKQMTAKEEDILTNRTYIKKGVVIDRLIQSVLIDKSIDVSSLYIGDKNAIMVASRISAYGPEYSVSLVCDQCGNKSNHSINLEETTHRTADIIEEEAVSNQALKHERLENGNILLKLPKTGWYAECCLMNGMDEKRLLQITERKRQAGQPDELSLSEQLGIIVVSINTVSDQRMLAEGIQNMPAFDAKYLRNTYSKLVPNVVIKKAYTCSACLSEQNVEVPFTQEFFWPK
jgi:hypothetical protein